MLSSKTETCIFYTGCRVVYLLLLSVGKDKVLSSLN